MSTLTVLFIMSGSCAFGIAAVLLLDWALRASGTVHDDE